jgi:hypothetical protein
MSRAARSRRRDAEEEEGEEEKAPPPKGRSSKGSVASRTEKEKEPAAKRGKGKGDKGDDDFPDLTFDMTDLDAELKEVDADGEPSPPRKSRFPTRPPIEAASSSKAGSKQSSRQSSTERGNGHSEEKIIKMSDLDRWKFATKYTDLGDQSDEAILLHQQKWSTVSLPSQDLVDVAATMQLRKFLWKNKKLVREGIPPCHRLFVWSVVSGARTHPDRMEHARRFEHYISKIDTLPAKIHKEIALDIPRALNAHPKFSAKGSREGAEELRRVLSAFAVRNTNIGYVNSLSHIAAFFLLYYKDEESFWILCSLVDIVLPPDYFTQSLLGVRAECMLMKTLVYQRLPKLHAHFAALGVDVYNVALKWLMVWHAAH